MYNITLVVKQFVQIILWDAYVFTHVPNCTVTSQKSDCSSTCRNKCCCKDGGFDFVSSICMVLVSDIYQDLILETC